jgi:hypothetical protein
LQNITRWMAWEGGLDLSAMTQPGLEQPNVILHVARMVHTPVGSAPSGMVLYQPDPGAPPIVAGFLSADPAVGAYFGPSIFAGTPFEHAPVLPATLEIGVGAGWASAVVRAGEWVFETRLGAFAPLETVYRHAGEPLPFLQQGIESAAAEAGLLVNGQNVVITVPKTGMAGGPGAAWSPCGMYAR